MNKIRLIKIFELSGKIHPIEAAIIELLDGIEDYSDGDYIDYIKDGEIYFSYDTNKKIYLTYDLYEEYKTNFGCSDEETKEIMKYLLDKHLKLKINDVR